MQQNENLNRVVIAMCRSLLQYTMEAWPWTPGNSHLREPLDEMIDEQRGRIERLCNLLDARGWTIEFGVFPDFTDLHFLALDFLLPDVVVNQRAVVAEIDAIRARTADDPEGAALLTEVAAGERGMLSKLEGLSPRRPEPVRV